MRVEKSARVSYGEIVGRQRNCVRFFNNSLTKYNARGFPTGHSFNFVVLKLSAPTMSWESQWTSALISILSKTP